MPVYCPNCGTTVGAERVKVTHSKGGGAFDVLYFCSACKTRAGFQADFCSGCGAKFVKDIESESFTAGKVVKLEEAR